MHAHGWLGAAVVAALKAKGLSTRCVLTVHDTEDVPEFDAAQAYNLTCGTCHGEAGDGNGPAGGALNPKPRDFTDAAWWDDEKTTDEYVAKVIKEGGPAVGLSPLMAPWGGQYDDEQIAAMVDHLKTFKK